MDIPERVKKLWGNWNIRVFVLLSLLSQILLVLLAPLRKSKSQKRVTWFVWVVYLVADWVAIFGLGLLSSSQDDSSVGSTGRESDLRSLWAPFLLLHLGGPDTITAFSVEDNELWLRQLFGLISQLLPAGYVFLRSLPGNKLLGPTILIFIIGIVKYCERTWALYQASSDVFSNNLARKSGTATNYCDLMEEYMAMRKTHSSREPQNLFDHLTRIQMTDYAYDFFHTWKALFVDFPTNFSEVMGIRSFILRWSAKDVFTMIGMELNFMYDVLYTKAAILHSRLGYVLRLISVCSIIAALFLFFFLEKSAHSHFDMAVIYTFFIGALSLEILGLFNLIISDWGIIALNSFSSIVPFIAKTHSYIFRGPRWSESIPQLNILTVALLGRQKLIEIIVSCLCLKKILDEMRNTSRIPIDDDVKSFIFENLKKKSRVKFSRHDLLQGQPVSAKVRWAKLSNMILKMNKPSPSHTMENIAESILVLHLATEICYNLAGMSIDNVCFANMEDPSSTTERRISKNLSDYMLYLLVMQPTIMASSGVWRIRYQDMCDKLKKIPLMDSSIDPPVDLLDPKSVKPHEDRPPKSSLTSEDLEFICAYLFRTYPKRWNDQILSSPKDSSVLNDAVLLIGGLIDKGEMIWTTIGNKWMDILCHTATRSRAYTHAQRLSEGGELLTFVWLLMAHLGLSNQLM